MIETNHHFFTIFTYLICVLIMYLNLHVHTNQLAYVARLHPNWMFCLRCVATVRMRHLVLQQEAWHLGRWADLSLVCFQPVRTAAVELGTTFWSRCFQVFPLGWVSIWLLLQELGCHVSHQLAFAYPCVARWKDVLHAFLFAAFLLVRHTLPSAFHVQEHRNFSKHGSWHKFQSMWAPD